MTNHRRPTKAPPLPRSRRPLQAAAAAVLLGLSAGCGDSAVPVPTAPPLMQSRQTSHAPGFFYAWTLTPSMLDARCADLPLQVAGMDARQERQLVSINFFWTSDDHAGTQPTYNNPVNDSQLANARAFAIGHPGRHYIIGDEPDQPMHRPDQDTNGDGIIDKINPERRAATPAEYADVYYRFVTGIQEVDPNATFSPAGFAQRNGEDVALGFPPGPHFTEYAQQFLSAYNPKPDPAPGRAKPPIHEWRFHRFAWTPGDAQDFQAWKNEVAEAANWSMNPAQGGGRPMFLGSFGYPHPSNGNDVSPQLRDMMRFLRNDAAVAGKISGAAWWAYNYVDVHPNQNYLLQQGRTACTACDSSCLTPAGVSYVNERRSLLGTGAPVGNGTGLLGTYFDNMDFSGASLSRTDATVDFNWGGAPAASLGEDTFSVRWTGQVQARETGTYVFSTWSDDGVRLWVNGQPVIDNWTDHAPTENASGAITLTAGQKYDVRMDFYENAGGAMARLSWTRPSGVQETIPASQLYPASSTGGGGTDTVWVEDSLPAGAIAESNGEAWSWVGGGLSGLAHASAEVSGMHQHYFYGTSQGLSLAQGDRLFTYVYLDPNKLPQQLMLQFLDGSWEHRAYWGADLMPWGTNGTESRRYMGPMPAAGGWVRLEVPASVVGLEGRQIHGIAYTLHGGTALWDRSGKASGTSAVGATPGTAGYKTLVFGAEDVRRTTHTGDWRPGSTQLECAAGEPMTGLSKQTSPAYATHAALCAPTEPSRYGHGACTFRNLDGQDDRGTTSTGEWATGYYKAECAWNEYMAGVARKPDGTLEGILCCAGNVGHNNCSAPIFLDTSAREQPSGSGEWDSGYWKGECGTGRYAAGLSRQLTDWKSPFSILCCSP